MNKHKPYQRLLAAVLSVSMALGMAPITAFAETPPIGTSGEIIAFEALSEETANREVPLGTSLKDLDLPATLNTTVRVATPTDAEKLEKDSGEPHFEDKGISVPVEWASDSDYDSDTADTYTFTAEVKSYVISAALPEITVTVREEEDPYPAGGEISSFDALIQTTDSNWKVYADDSGPKLEKIVGINSKYTFYYNCGFSLRIYFHFDKNVQYNLENDKLPYVNIRIGDAIKTLNFEPEHSSSTFASFAYDVENGLLDLDGIEFDENKIHLNGATITDSSTNKPIPGIADDTFPFDASLDVGAPISNYKVDTIPPELSGIEDEKIYTTAVTPVYSGGEGKCWSITDDNTAIPIADVKSGMTLSRSGRYQFRVSDGVNTIYAWFQIILLPTPVSKPAIQMSGNTATIQFEYDPQDTYACSFTASATPANGGAPILSSSVSQSPITFSGLTNGAYSFTVTATNLAGSSISQSSDVAIIKEEQEALSVSAVTDKKYGDAPFTLSTTGGSGEGAVTFESSDPAVLNISGNTATIHKAGAVTITATKAQDSTYNEATVSIPITIHKKSLTVTVDDKLNIIKGSAMPELTFAVSGLVSGDTFTQPIISTTAADTNTVGEYPISISGGTLNNADSYTVSYVSGKLAVVNEVYTVTVTNGTGSGSYSENQLVTITANNRQGYTFTSWSSADGVSFADSKASTTTFTMPGKAVAITANYSTNSGGNGGSSDDGSSSGGSSGSTTTPATTSPGKAPNQPVTAAAPVTATAGKNGTASAEIPEKSIADAIAKAQADAKAQGKTANGISVEMNVTLPKGVTSLSATLPRKALDSLISTGVTDFKIQAPLVTVTFDKKALTEIQKQSNGNINITIVPNAKISASAKPMIGTRPVYDLTVSYQKDGKNATVSSFGGGTATVSVPYTPAKGEAIGGLYAVYVDAKGNATRIAGSAYDANSGCVMFTTTHFSLYGIGYTAPSAKFTDIKTHWGKESIDYVVGRGLLSGTTETAFAPDTAMTRGMLVTALGRLAGVDTKAYSTNSFTDVKADSAFRPYIEWAYKKGVVQGTGNGKFEPDSAITREEIAVIFANFAKATGYTLPVTRTATTYADASSIGSTYQTAVTAMQQAGIMMGGTSNKFNPKSSATRAEVSSMLHRYIKLTIDPATAQGWAKNDAGQYLYYKNGKALTGTQTGTQTINGVKYFFNTDGTLKTGWVKDDAGNWRFYSGNTMLVGFWDLGANGNNKTYYFNKDGIMVAGKWLEIDGKWYYFNADGSLAKSTKIDEYEVDANGVRKTK